MQHPLTSSFLPRYSLSGDVYPPWNWQQVCTWKCMLGINTSFLCEWPMFRGEMLVSGSVSWFFVGQLLLCPYGNNVTKVLNMLNIALLDFLWQTNFFFHNQCLNLKCCKGNTCSSVFTRCVALDVSQPILACMVSMRNYMANNANA